jgi:hypothetical protein
MSRKINLWAFGLVIFLIFYHSGGSSYPIKRAEILIICMNLTVDSFLNIISTFLHLLCLLPFSYTVRS